MHIQHIDEFPEKVSLDVLAGVEKKEKGVEMNLAIRLIKLSAVHLKVLRMKVHFFIRTWWIFIWNSDLILSKFCWHTPIVDAHPSAVFFLYLAEHISIDAMHVEKF